MARKTGTRNVTSNDFQRISADTAVKVTSPDSVELDAGNQVIINEGGADTQINPNGGNVQINQTGGGTTEVNDGGGDVFINASGGGNLEVGALTQFTDGSNPTNLLGIPLTIDQTEFSNTAGRQAASVYFAGGVGIEKDLAVGGTIFGKIAQALTSTNIQVTATNTNIEFYPIFAQTLTATNGTTLFGDPDDTDIDTTSTIFRYNPSIGRLRVSKIEVKNTETSTSTDTGALKIAGGASVEKDLTIGGVVYGDNNFTTQYL